MINQPLRWIAFICGLTLAGFVLTNVQPAAAQPAAPKRIGVVETLFQDMSAPAKKGVAKDLDGVVHKHTGLTSRSVLMKDPLEIAKQMEDGKLDLAIMNGYEFAWAKEKCDKLKPLMIAVARYTHRRAYLITRNDQPFKGLADLNGLSVSLPKKTTACVRLFLQREINKTGKTTPQIVRHPDIESGIDDVVRGKVAAAVVDRVSLYSYNLVKPGAYKRLRILQQSAKFPAGVICYVDGMVDADTLGRFRNGLLAANDDGETLTMMRLWRLTAFQDIPIDYEPTLIAIRKVYPAPSISK